jgi:hypothetical protein
MLKLPTLPRGISLVDKMGLPSVQFQTWWQSVVRAVQTQEAAQDEIIADLQAVQTQQAAMLTDIQTIQDEQAAQLVQILEALDLANAAQAAADTVTTANAISASWISPADVLMAEDAGTDASITIDDFTRFYDDGTNTEVTGGTLTGLSYSTLYSIYYDDPSRADETPTFVATTFGGVARHNFAPGRHFVGTVTTPAAGAPPNDGGGYVPPGGGGTNIP